MKREKRGSFHLGLHRENNRNLCTLSSWLRVWKLIRAFLFCYFCKSAENLLNLMNLMTNSFMKLRKPINTSLQFTSIWWCLCILKQLTSWCMILQFMFPLSYQLCEITHDFKPTLLSLKTCFHKSWHRSVYTNGDQSSSFCVSNWSSIWSFICIMKQFTNTISYYTSYIIYHHIIIYLSIYLSNYI